LNSLLFSIVCLTVNTLSMHDLPILNPFCSSSNVASDIFLKRCVIPLTIFIYFQLATCFETYVLIIRRDQILSTQLLVIVTPC
jgi:hypothetical protein